MFIKIVREESDIGVSDKKGRNLVVPFLNHIIEVDECKYKKSKSK